MRVININLDELASKSLDIGYVGESHHVKVVIHCASFFKSYPNAVASMIAGATDGTLYPVILDRQNSSLVWNISDSDVARVGGGRYQLTFTQGEEIIKTEYGSYSVSQSMVVNGEPPEPIEDWMQEAQQVLNDLESFNDISASATMLPAGSTATAEMTTVEGHKNVALGIPKGDKGDKGNTGNTGATPDISIGTVETLQPDQEAYAELDESSTPEAPVINFGLPKGETGAIENVYGSTIEMTSQDSTKVSAAINSKLSANQGAGNAGKFMKVGNDGALLPANVDGTTTPMSQSDNTTVKNAIDGKVDKNQGISYAGYFMKVNSSGNVVPMEFILALFSGATASTDGNPGLVIKPLAGDQGKFLRGDATWANVPNPVMTGATASSAGSSGLVPAPSAGDQDKVLKGNGTWGTVASATPLQEGLAIIVDGDTCITAVPVGGYAYIKNNTHSLPEGLYKNTSASAFPVSGGTADSTVFTAVSGGALNEIADNKFHVGDTCVVKSWTWYGAGTSGNVGTVYITLPKPIGDDVTSITYTKTGTGTQGLKQDGSWLSNPSVTGVASFHDNLVALSISQSSIANNQTFVAVLIGFTLTFA